MMNDIARAIDALHAIPADITREEWVKVGMACQASGLDFDTWDRWSQPAHNYSANAARDTWKSFQPGRGIGSGTLFHIARQYGWSDGRPPQSKPAPVLQRQPEPARKPAPGMSAAEVWERCEPATNEHAYIVAKGATDAPIDGLRVLPAGDALSIARQSMAGSLVVPAYAADGALQSLQLIPPPNQGKKLNLAGSLIAGAAFTVGKVERGAPVYIVEGIGQAWACCQSTGHAAIVCFGWGNVGRIAAIQRQQNASARLVLVPDAGKEQDALRIAQEVGAAVVCMPEGEDTNFDCNDYAQREGYPALADLLALAEKPETPIHPLARIVEPSPVLQPPRWLLPGLMAEGLTVIAGGHGVGKTTALLPLAAGVAGLHESSWPLAPKNWRHVVYITEDIDQAQRIIHGLASHLFTTIEAISERLHLVEAQRMETAYVVQVGDTYTDRFTRMAGDVELLPLVVVDTQAATIHLENENDNSEASSAVAMLKQQFSGLPVWMVSHLSKTGLNRGDAQNLTARGASAWEADANATAFLVKEGDGDNATRWLVLGKRRFEPRWSELALETHTLDAEGADAWGDVEKLVVRWAIARPSNGTRREQAARLKEAQAAGERAALDSRILSTVERAYAAGEPLNRSAVKKEVGGKNQTASDAISRLLDERWLWEVEIPKAMCAKPSKAAFLVALTAEERARVLAGYPAPEAKTAIPDSWKKQVASVPRASKDEAPEKGGAA